MSQKLCILKYPNEILTFILDESPTSTNLGNGHEFIIKKPKAKPCELMLKVDNIISESRIIRE